jgi:hypothetical protein
MKKSRIILIILILLVAVNLPPIKWLTGGNDCSYSNGDGSFTFGEMNFKEYNYQVCQARFKAYKTLDPSDTTLYRLSRINLLRFWRWGEYLFAPNYRLAFRDWQDIEAKRKPVVNKSGFQDF